MAVAVPILRCWKYGTQWLSQLRKFVRLRKFVISRVRCENAWRDGYQEVTTIPSGEKARDVYEVLCFTHFGTRFGAAKRTLGNAE